MSKTYNSLTQTQLTTVFYIFIYEAWRRYVFPFSPPGNVLQAVWQNNCGRFDAGYVRNQKKKKNNGWSNKQWPSETCRRRIKMMKNFKIISELQCAVQATETDNPLSYTNVLISRSDITHVDSRAEWTVSLSLSLTHIERARGRTDSLSGERKSEEKKEKKNVYSNWNIVYWQQFQ